MKTSTWILLGLAAGAGVLLYRAHSAEAAQHAANAQPSLQYEPSTKLAAQNLLAQLQTQGCPKFSNDPGVQAFQMAFATDPEGDVGANINGVYDEPTAEALILVLGGAQVPAVCSS